MPGAGLAKAGRSAAVVPSSSSPQDGGRVVSPPLTRPEQHGPVEPRGLGGAPCPLAQPLRHPPARACGAGTEGGERTPGRSVPAAVTRSPRPKPRRRSDYLRGRSAGSRGTAAGEGPGQGRVTPSVEQAVRAGKRRA